MLHGFRDRFGTAGLVIGVIALIAALGGTALAASALTGKQKKEVEKIAKKFAGKPGAPGAAGAAGTNGKDGANGTNGSDGAAGAAGTSATTVSFSGNAHGCTEGGIEVKSASAATFVCNGPEGEQGEGGATGATGAQGLQGEPWTAGGTLPPGSTETGSWAFNGTVDDTEGVRTAISFPIPYAFPLKAVHIHIGEENEPGFVNTCSGTAFKPTAPPGELCVYYSESEGLVNATASGIFRYNFSAGATRTGAMLEFVPTGGEGGEEPGFGAGSFAVTGCTETTPEVCSTYGP